MVGIVLISFSTIFHEARSQSTSGCPIPSATLLWVYAVSTFGGWSGRQVSQSTWHLRGFWETCEESAKPPSHLPSPQACMPLPSGLEIDGSGKTSSLLVFLFPMTLPFNWKVLIYHSCKNPTLKCCPARSLEAELRMGLHWSSRILGASA